MLYAIIMALFIEYLLGASKKLGPFYGTLIFTTLKQSCQQMWKTWVMYMLKVTDQKIVKLEFAHGFFCPQSCVARRRCACVFNYYKAGETWGTCEKMIRYPKTLIGTGLRW